MFSAIILTKNEEKNIQRCIESLAWCDEIIVVDDYSEDKMIEKLSNYPINQLSNKPIIKMFLRKLSGDFAGQRNFGLSKAKGEWVLFIDADEVVTEELQEEIKVKCLDSRLRGNDSESGYYVKRSDYFLGRWLQFGETGDIKLLRLAKKDAGAWKGNVHEIWDIRGPIGELDNPILHYPHATVSSFLKKINTYTTLLSSEWVKEKKIVSSSEIFLFPVGKFLVNYILKRGFRDGVAGLIMAVMMSFHSFLVRAKTWLARKH